MSRSRCFDSSRGIRRRGMNRQGGCLLRRAVCAVEMLELRRLMSASPGGFTQAFNYVENAPAVQLAGVGITSDDPAETFTATLTLADPAAGALGGMSTNGGGQFDPNTGVWPVTGDTYAVN